jgi:hypothetical protein
MGGATTGQSKSNEWRRLCAIALKEQDPERLTSLVNQILDALDERDSRLARNLPQAE